MSDANNSLKRKKPLAPEKQKELFEEDTAVVAEQTAIFVQSMHPAYLVNSKENAMKLSYEHADAILDAFTFYRLTSCTAEKTDELFEQLSSKMEKFYTAIHSLGAPVVYGVISYQGSTNLVIGIYDQCYDASILKGVLQGLLDDIELQPYAPNFCQRPHGKKTVGLVSAVPSTKIGDDKQIFEIAPLLRSLNGQNYTLLFLSRPIEASLVEKKYGELISVRDQCFSVSKRNVSRQFGTSHAEGETEGETKTHTEGESSTVTKGHNTGLSIIIASIGWNKSKSKTNQTSDAVAKSLSKTVTDTINENRGISSDVQNGFALELMDYADKAIERLRQGRSNGMWETVISYSADDGIVAGIIQACIAGELSRPAPDILPLTSIKFMLNEKEADNNSLLIPKIVLGEEDVSPLCTAMTSEELGFISTPPTGIVPDFEIKQGKSYPLVTHDEIGVEVGKLCDGQRVLENMTFSLSPADLAKHTFVCGITGSGKTTTVKNIIRHADVPFLVIESAKKEYRNILLEGKNEKHGPKVYTLGKPEINCPRFNPFYIQCGVSPQMHIDYLKDLFNASFSFYGPMPYILEKCLQNIYINKGWNLTLGFHPLLANTENLADFFEADFMEQRYKTKAHKYLFPTMQELKNEIERYIETEMQYEGEVAGNIKTAIRARLEGLCSGSKGFMFNTLEYADMGKILEENTVFELEGLADDADKAFCVGLLIIFINEYRQISHEIRPATSPLSHLLVIEEAHRLLKNVSVDRTTEDMGNPKGKAVEHFTNMIAEMRAYGQGVIVAEQIPSKLAPEVIKNSSNKIVQRLVASDDQSIIANTVGMSEKDAVYLGTLRTGYALCHKEGMSLPTVVKIPLGKDVKISDAQLYRSDENMDSRAFQINCGIAKEILSADSDLVALQMLNTILTEPYDTVQNAIKEYQAIVRSRLIQGGAVFVPTSIKDTEIYAEILSESVLRYLIHGVYQTKELIADEICADLKSLLSSPRNQTLDDLKRQLRRSYADDPAYKAKRIISQMVENAATSHTNLSESIRRYFMKCSDATVAEIRKMIRGADCIARGNRRGN